MSRRYMHAMSAPAVAHHMADVMDLAAQLAAALRSGVLQRMEEAADGPPARPVEGGRAPSGPHADPTAAEALGVARSPSLAVLHRREVVTAIARAYGHLSAALELTELYPAPRPADAADRAALVRLNGREPGCENCARVIGPAGVPRWEPIDSRLQEATTVGGRLAEPHLLCSWCHDRTRAWGRLPTPAEVARHHEGLKVPWPADVPPPDRKRRGA